MNLNHASTNPCSCAWTYPLLIAVSFWGFSHTSAEDSAQKSSTEDGPALLDRQVEELLSQGRLKKALSAAQEVLKSRAETDASSPEYASSLQRVASILYALGRYEEAEKAFKSATTLRRRVLGDDHVDYAESLHDVAKVYDALDRRDDAMVAFREAFEIRKAQLGGAHEDSLETLDELARLAKVTQKFERAVLFAEEAVRIRGESLGEGTRGYRAALRRLAGVYDAAGNSERAVDLFEREARIERATKAGPADPLVVVDTPATRAARSGGGLAHTALTVAILPFANETISPGFGHWRHSIARLLITSLQEVRSLRMVRSATTAASLRQANLQTAAAFESTVARRVGEHLLARRVVYGSVRLDGPMIDVFVRVLNTATGEESAELSASGDDWFDVRDRLMDLILRELEIAPSLTESERMRRRWTDSASALNSYGQGYAAQASGQSLDERERYVRQALEDDPRFAEAQVALAAILGTQQKFGEAERAARAALELRPDFATARHILGTTYLLRGQGEKALQELSAAHRLDPFDPEPLSRLGQFLASQREWNQAALVFERARRADPNDGSVLAYLGFVNAAQGRHETAFDVLAEAERFDSENSSEAQVLSQSYEILGDLPAALRLYRRFSSQAKRQKMSANVLKAIDDKRRQLEGAMKAEYVEASRPTTYTRQSLNSSLEMYLDASTIEQLDDLLTGSAEIEVWSREITSGLETGFDKARALLGALPTVEQGEGRGEYRDAATVFARSRQASATFTAADVSKLYVAAARTAGLDAFYVHVEQDERGRVVDHNCAAVFVQKGVLLVDGASRWFGVPHRKFTILDDFQAVAHEYVRTTTPAEALARTNHATQMHPSCAWARLSLAAVLLEAGELDSARKQVETADSLEPGRWEGFLLRGLLALRNEEYRASSKLLRRALTINRSEAAAHYYLALALEKEAELGTARTEHAAVLRYDPSPELAQAAARAALQIEERLAGEQSRVGDIRDTPEALTTQAELLASSGREDDALPLLERAIELQPDSPEVWGAKASLMLQLSRYEEARDDAERAVSLAPGDIAARLHQATALIELGFYGNAVRSLDETLRQQPESFVAQTNKGVALYRLGECGRAIACFDAAIGLSPDFSDAWANKAATLAKCLGEHEAALEAVEKAIESRPQHAQLWFNKGVYLRTLERLGDAIAAFERAEQLGHPFAARAIQRFR